MGQAGVRVAGFALVAATVVAGGCNNAPERLIGPATTRTIGGQPPVQRDPIAAPAAPGERRPVPVSFLMRAVTCERFAVAARAAALEAVGPYGFNGNYGYGDRAFATPATTTVMQETAGAAKTPAAQAGNDFSGTNVQEAGVDEPDSVKTDGRMLLSSVDGRLRVLDVTGSPRLVSSLDLPLGGGNLLLVGDKVLVLGAGENGSPVPMNGMKPGGFQPGGVYRPTTVVTVVDLKDPAKPTVARTHTIDGAYVDARLIGGVARIVTRSQPNLVFPQPTSNATGIVSANTAVNTEVIRKAGPAAFLPEGASCADAYVTAEPAGPGTVSVQSLDPTAAAPGPAVTVMADASTVYASAGRLFVATNRYVKSQAMPTDRVVPAEPGRTAIHAFDITDPAKARYVGSGDVPGHLLNQFSLSEDAGVLRVATTTEARFNPAVNGTVVGPQSGSPTVSQSRVSILRPAGEEWVETGAVEGLGKGERIYAVRFIGTTGYIVTFRQVDPLYVLDLRDIHAPTLTGELKITGYSAYLHPAGTGRLLGIGQEASEQGRRQGSQLSLFDVGNPAAPAKLAGTVLPNANSTAEYEHHAFLFWPKTGLVVAPIVSYGSNFPNGRIVPVEGSKNSAFVGAVAFKVGDKSVSEAGRITHPGSTPIERSLVVGDRLLTVSRVGLAMNNVDSLADSGFIAFR